MGGFRLMRPQSIVLLLCAAVLQAGETIPRIEVLEGDGAINNIGAHRAKEPVVRVVDQDGKPLPNVAVTFTLPEQGPSGLFTDGKTSYTVMTDDTGQAAGRGLKPNSSPGQFRISVSASLQGRVATVTLIQTNAEPAGASKSSRTLIILAVVGGAAAAGAAVGLAGKKSSSSSGPPSNPGAIITPGTPSFGHP